MRKYVYWIFAMILLIAGFILLIYFSVIKNLANGEIQDSKIRFEVEKNYVYNVFFEGIIINKETDTLNQNNYSIDIFLKNIYPLPTLAEKSTLYFYYYFKNDSLLNLSIDDKLYQNININDTITKCAKDYCIKINNKKLPLISTDKNKWFP